MAKQTVSWLDFLFDSTGELLAKHIGDPLAEPSPAQLIVQFLERSGVSANNVNQQEITSVPQPENKRARRLGQLALHVAYQLKWNLEILEDSLPLQWQNVLFSELLKTAPATEQVSSADINLKTLDPPSVMIMILYHRWVVRTVAQHFIPSFGKPTNNNNGLIDAVVTDNILRSLREKLPTSLHVLEQAVNVSQDLCLPRVPITYDPVKKNEAPRVAELPKEVPPEGKVDVKEEEKMEVETGKKTAKKEESVLDEAEDVNVGVVVHPEGSSEEEKDTSREGIRTEETGREGIRTEEKSREGIRTEETGREGIRIEEEKKKMVVCEEGAVRESIKVTKDEIGAQVSFDIATLYFYQEKFEQAANLFEGCKKAKCPHSSFYTVERGRLDGYYSACCGLLGRPSDPTVIADPQLGPLDMKIEQCRDTGYKGIISLLIEDNISKCLPREYRSSLEDELRDRAATDKMGLSDEEDIPLAWQAVACNGVRDALDSKPVQPVFWWSVKRCNHKELECLLSICVQSVPIKDGNSVSKELECNPRFTALKSFVKLVCHSVEKIDGWNILFESEAKVFANEEDEQLYNSSRVTKEKMERLEWASMELYHLQGLERDAKLESGFLQHQLLTTFDAEEVDRVVNQLHGLDPGRKHAERFVCMLYKSYLDEVRDLMLQDVLHVLLSKAFYCSTLKEYSAATKLLGHAVGAVDERSRQAGSTPALDRITTALHQELMILGILQGTQQTDKKSELATRIKSYVWQTRQGATTHAHIEKEIVIILLNSKEWELIQQLKPDENLLCTDYRKLSNLLANTCSSLAKPQLWRKMARNLWEGVLRIFSGTGQQKRQSDGSAVGVKRDAAGLTVTDFSNFVQQLTEETALSVLVSCLVRLHNALKVDTAEGKKEIWSSYVHLWPTSVTNASQVNSDQVTAVMSQTVNHAISVQPNNPSWLHTLADVYLGSSNYSAALKCYLEAGAACSSFFSVPVPPSVWDEQVYKKMVICCSALKAHVQAAIFCQCLDPVDYPTAFKALQQAVSASEDAMDYYYSFFWDITVLEYLVNIHAKRGQHDKKKLAVHAISQPDLNTFNSTDVLQHAEQSRRSRFFRSLAKQFL